MSTPLRERATALRRAHNAVAQPPESGWPCPSYSPTGLLLIRWLAVRPGGDTISIAAAHELWPAQVRPVLARLRRLGVIHWIAGRGWHLTELGQRLREVIDDEGVV